MNLFLIFQYGLVGAFVVLLGTFLFVMVSESVEGGVSQLFGLSAKNETLTFLGIGMGGVLLALQAMMSYKRAKALEDTASAQAEAAKAQAKATEEQAKANQNTEQGQRQERLKNAIEHLGNDSVSVRLGGAYELFHLAQDTKDLRQTVLDILCAHIRQTTGEDEYRKKYKSKPSEEIQSLLTLLFVQKYNIFRGLHINLQESWLNGANLRGAYLENAVLGEAHLKEADLSMSQIQGAGLWGTNLQGAGLWGTNLQGAILDGAHLQGSILRGSEMQGANLTEAQFQGADLGLTNMQGANLTEAQFQGVDLSVARLQAATLEGARLQGVTSHGDFFFSSSHARWIRFDELQRANDQEALSFSFEERIRDRIGKESDLSGVILAGLPDGQVELNFPVEGLSDEKEKELRGKLESHRGKPESNELPENSDAITGAYTAEEAEQWMAEYNEAMSEVPEKGNN